MKLVLTGATGFIGQHLVQQLLQAGHSVCVITRPSSRAEVAAPATSYVFDGDIDQLISFFQTEQFAGVIHLASLFLAQHTTKDIAGLINSNVLFSTTILQAAVTSQIPWFINTGTFWQHYQNADYSPVNLYAATKQAFQSIAQYYIETSPINFVTLKLSDTFGPGDTRPKIFNLWLKHSISGEPLDMSPGDQQIDISYIDNVVSGYQRLMELLEHDTTKQLSGRSFALRSGETRSLKDLAKLFEQVTQRRLTINWGKRSYRPREVMQTWSEGELIPGWTPSVSVADGIKKTFNPLD